MFKKSLFKNSPPREEGDSSSSPPFLSSSTTPKKIKKENPYAVGGRDKFAMILADLDKKRRKIYEQVGTQDISKVRFGYVDSQKWVPIVVRSSKDHRQDGKPKFVPSHNLGKEENQLRGDVDGNTEKKSLHESVGSLSKYIPTSGDFPIVFVLVLCCLGVCGVVLAVICTCIWCFLVSRVKINEGNSKELVKRRDHERLGEKTMESDVVTSAKTRISDISASPKRLNLSQGLNARMASPKTNLTPAMSPKKDNMNPTKSPMRDFFTPPLSPKKDYVARGPPFTTRGDYSVPPRGYFSPAMSPKRASVASSSISPTETPPRHIRAYNKSW